MSERVDKYSKYKERLIKHQEQNLIRSFVGYSDRFENQYIINNQKLINFASNDYLGLTTNPKVKASLINAVEKNGFGSGSSQVICGYSSTQKKLEETFAEFINREEAIFFNSGYMANIGVISALANRESCIISDKLCHASIIDGIILSRAKYKRFNHCDMTHLNKILEKNKADLIISESIFSMEGDIAPVDQLVKIANKKESLLMVDDAHGIGVLGENGQGIVEYFNLDNNDLDILITPLGKAFAGTGAFVSGKKELIEFIRQFSRSLHYATALPPFIAEGLLTVIEIIKNEKWRKEKLKELVTYFIEKVKNYGLNLISDELTSIKSIDVSDNIQVLDIQKQLFDLGFWVSAIRPPTVPQGTSRIRVSLNANHTKNEIDGLLRNLSKLIEKNKKIESNGNMICLV